MSDLPQTTLQTTVASGTATSGEKHLKVTLTGGNVAALAAKLTLQDAATGERILPAFYSDNYVSLLPGETKVVDIAYPASAAHGAVKVGLRGWNIAPTTMAVQP